MWDVTGWAAATWLKSTLLLGLLVAATWLTLGTGSGWFWTITAIAGATDVFIARQLSREWRYEASLRWWWTR